MRFILVLLSFGFITAQSVENKKKFTGFFDFYYEPSSDKILLEVDKIDYEFLYVPSLSSGIGSNDIGLDRGQLGRERIVKFIKRGNKLLLIEPNSYYRSSSNNQNEIRSIEQAFAKSILYGFEIKDHQNNIFTIDFTPFLLEDRHGVAERLRRTGQGNYSVNKSSSAIELSNTKGFPNNIEFESLLTFSGKSEGKWIQSVAPDSNNVTVIQHHSFVKLPDDNYKPRSFDPRSGAISVSYMDYSSPIDEKILKKNIIRHRLEKKFPENEKSEAIRPIVYYLDPGTPEPIRSALIDGAMWWNEAFESIGFIDAFQVKILPENADPMDCRYNVIQWVHRSTRGWSYGSNVSDPRTGEIIKGHVSLGSLRVRQDYLIAQSLIQNPYLAENKKKVLEMSLARIRQLSAHEVGHTLGFAHNFSSSTKQRSSVMDYPHPLIKIKDDKINLDSAYAVGIGDWDKISVAYSYSEFKKNQNEKNELNKILDKSYDDGYRFITDYDARSVGGAHVNAHLWDNSEDVTSGLDEIIKIRQKAIINFSENNISVGSTYSELEDAFVPIYFLHRYQTEAVVKLIGGLDYNYSLVGDGQLVVKTLDHETQLNALKSVLSTLDENFLTIPTEKLKLFPPRAYGFPRTRESFNSQMGVAFDPISAASTSSDMTLSLLLNHERLNRVNLQSSMKTGISVNKIFESLFKILNDNLLVGEKNYAAIVKDVVAENILKHFMNISVNDKYVSNVQANADYYLNEFYFNLQGKINKRNLKSRDKYYINYLLKIIQDFKKSPDKFQLKNAPKIPDGSPIGSYKCQM
tara:strand:- start:6534 stop:8936 length:2403 start_codon:yes stop_codon:yes gene_type:complete